MTGATPGAAPAVAGRGTPFAEASLGELVRLWNRAVWWVGIRPMFRRMLELNLTLAESIVLRSLQRGPLTVAEVAECLFISHSAASRAIDRLVQDGFVSRQENPEDRRQKQLTLTPEGAGLVGNMEGVFTERLERIVGTLGSDDQEQLRLLLTRMLAVYLAGQDDEEEAWRGGCPVARRGGAASDPRIGQERR